VAFTAGLIAALGGGLIGPGGSLLTVGWVDDLVSRLVELKLAIPAILFVALVRPRASVSRSVVLVAGDRDHQDDGVHPDLARCRASS
jgi:ABC-type dipeptide/oligopeptide/nickel transport system permease subunit